jgi:CRISPR-associated endonuclease/helicase Cas3
MTSLEDHTGRPEVAPWLHGWVADDLQTAVLWRAYLPVRQGIANWPRTAFQRKEIEAFFESAPPHESEKLETETYRVVAWLRSRANSLLGRDEPASEQQAAGEDSDSVLATEAAEPGEAEAPSAAPQMKKLRRNELVALVLASDGSYAAHYSLGHLALKREGKAKDDFQGGLAGKIVILDARFGGLEDGLLNDKGDSQFLTADASDDWSKEAGFQVRLLRSAEEEEESEKGWRFAAEFVLRRDTDGNPVERQLAPRFCNFVGES